MKGLHAQCSFPPSRVSLEEKTSFSSEIEPKGKVHQALYVMEPSRYLRAMGVRLALEGRANHHK